MAVSQAFIKVISATHSYWYRLTGGLIGGNDRHPAWWLNLEANPQAEVQVGSVTKKVRAERAKQKERSRLWPLLVDVYSGYEGYQARNPSGDPQA